MSFAGDVFLLPPFFEFFFSLSLFFEKYVGFSIHTVDATVGIVRRLKKNLRTFVAKILATTRANKEILFHHDLSGYNILLPL